MLPFDFTRSETSPRTSGVVPLTKYQTGTPVWSYITIIPGALPLKPLWPVAPIDAGMMLTSVQPDWVCAVSLTVIVPSGSPAGSAPVVKLPVALDEPPASDETALIRYVVLAYMPITRTLCDVTGDGSTM